MDPLGQDPGQFPGEHHHTWFWDFPFLYFIVHMPIQLFSKQGNISTIEALDF